MTSVVITGSTRGIGFGLAEAFLALDCSVTISGRTEASVKEAIARLTNKHGDERILGQACDVTKADEVQSLWDTAQSRFRVVDIWINNAGIANSVSEFRRLPTEEIREVVETNLVGLMFGARVALNSMIDQGHGSLYNLEGLGSTGRRVPGLSVYGSTKAGVRYFTDALADEAQGTPVIVGALSPGMVMTDMLKRELEAHPEDRERTVRVFNILADRVETVAPWLAQQVLENKKNGARIVWLTRTKILSRFLLAPFQKRDVVS
jgi:NAD(P)-dependent dehydrogenase (short-subunit alcohol dehydrogenase family)